MLCLSPTQNDLCTKSSFTRKHQKLRLIPTPYPIFSIVFQEITSKIAQENRTFRQILSIDKPEAALAGIHAQLAKSEAELVEPKSLENAINPASFDYTECEKVFNSLNTPEFVQNALFEAKKRKERINKARWENFRPITFSNPPKESELTKSLEEELLELSDRAMECVEGQGEVIVFNPSEILDPFSDLLEENDFPEHPKPKRKNTQTSIITLIHISLSVIF
eukprot:TRINITY_DN121105_c0_g1_i1.p2 TRINITY_DN121105_c0_g1~~TRINITY_DN121105_c0_g1_i1.p2  ORF type:complete len:222 (-),score=6.12 TRINITY_DN121105_c0_g1_i1:1045-1710(-)